jgi:catechol 2,3-dioxygenase-like lactoylglutathione lyase family enzyme
MSTPAIPGIRFDHVSISVADLDAQVAWYQRALGFAEVVERYELTEPPVRTAILQAAPGIRIELIERVESERTGEYSDPLDMTRSQGYGHWAVDVDDLDAAFAWLIDAGATEVWPPADAVAPGARFGYVKDPEGNLIELIQPATPGQRGGVC